ETLTFEGRRITGLDLVVQNVPSRVTAGREVVLAAGAIGSPQILQLSGIGPADLLSQHGIDVVAGMDGVGGNLMDHLQLRTIFKIQNALTLNERQKSLWGKAKIALEYALKRSGPMAMAPSQLGIFTRSNDQVATPNIEYHVQPLSLDKFGDPLHDFPAITVSVCNLRPESRGEVRLSSSDPYEAPVIAP
ncbi:MAG: GMC family oxidoreductase N-terminal domain-containing protein, partial [Cohaesibacter sp.]|nr:GMC family oxidoreductase N-terminal domain-containing protein [Cohaesibacter sp.]